MDPTLSTPAHGGLMFPLDAFRPTMLAAAFAELLVGKARNILDATLELTRHPQIPLVLARVHGAVAQDPVEFWSGNPELCVFASQIVPRQCFSYYVSPPPDTRQGFLVAQRGQPLAKEDATVDTMPADAMPADWPVARLCEQLQLSLDELASGFEGGPRIEIGLLEPSGNDQDLLRALAGAPPDADDDLTGDEEALLPDNAPASDGPRSAQPTPSGAGGRGQARPDQVAADIKRRATEREEERKERESRAAEFADGLAHEIDDFGIVVAPQAELADADLLTPYVQRHASRDLPAGISMTLADTLAGRRIDFAVRVDFLSEVFVDAAPLSKATFTERAQSRTIGNESALVLEVLAPRLGAGTLVQIGSARVFVSRPVDMALPERLVLELAKG